MKRFSKLVTVACVAFLGMLLQAYAQITNLETMLSSSDTYASSMGSIFWKVFYVCAGLTVGVLVWRKFKKGSSA